MGDAGGAPAAPPAPTPPPRPRPGPRRRTRPRSHARPRSFGRDALIERLGPRDRRRRDRDLGMVVPGAVLQWAFLPAARRRGPGPAVPDHGRAARGRPSGLG